MQSTDDAILNEASERIGYTFRDPELLRVALRHASIADTRLESNERLEFLGDAVLGMIVCDYLYATFPDLLEGELTKIKSAAVSRRLCAKIANSLGLDRLLEIGKGMRTRSSLPASLSAAVLEAVIGAIYLDSDIETVRGWLMPLMRDHIDRAAKSGHQQNFKSCLQHYASRHFDMQPQYVLLDEKGPDHAKCFQVAVEVGAQRFEPCWAASKKQAEQQAALEALKAMGAIDYTEEGHAVFVGNGRAPSVAAGDEG